MDIFTAIHSRRSVRAYTGEPVTTEETRAMLDAAMTAPSAGNARPWHFLVIDDPVSIAQIPSLNPYAGMAPAAAVCILVCGDLSLEKYPGFWVQDCSAAIQNLLLAAVGLGLGAVWTGIHPLEDRVRAFASLFALPPNIVPLALIAVGRPKKEQQRLSRYEEEKVHYNRYGQAWKVN